MSDVLVRGLPDWCWGRLATIADNRHVTVADLVAEAVLDVISADTDRLAELELELVRARASGHRVSRRGATARRNT